LPSLSLSHDFFKLNWFVKGIFHTDRPIAQTHLSQQLSSLVIPLPHSLFVPFLTAFYTTLSANFSLIPSLRLDKYLYLIRRYISVAFTYLSLHAWSSTLMSTYLALLQGPVGPLSKGVGDEAKVPDGLRYHVLDVWVEELVPILKEGEEDEVGEVLMDAVRRLEGEGRGKALRKRAKEAVREWDKRNDEEETAKAESRDEAPSPVHVQRPSVPSDDEWEGFES
jgi:ribosomal RNA-processing protein 1